MPIYKRGVDEGLDSDCGQLFTKNYSIIKTGFTFVFSSLTCKLLFLLHLTLNKSSFPGIIFLRIIIIYIMLLTEHIFFFHKLVNSYSKFYLQVDLTISPFQSDRGTLQELVLKISLYLCRSLFLIECQALGSTTLLKGDNSTDVFLLILRNFSEHLF